MLAELLAAASIAVGSMTARTMTPPKVGTVDLAKDKLVSGRLSERLSAISSRMREATGTDDVPWLVCSVAVGHTTASLRVLPAASEPALGVQRRRQRSELDVQ